MREDSHTEKKTVDPEDSGSTKDCRISAADSPAAKGSELAARSDLPALEEIMKILLSPQGCPWDRKQTHETLIKYMREETEEVAQAVIKQDWENLKEELGDCLLQIAFHCEIARLEGHFTMADVIRGINSKMVRRHPHVFGEKTAENPEAVLKLWNEIKKKEKEDKK